MEADFGDIEMQLTAYRGVDVRNISPNHDAPFAHHPFNYALTNSVLILHWCR